MTGSRTSGPHNPLRRHPFLSTWYVLVLVLGAVGNQGELSRALARIGDSDERLVYTLGFLHVPVVVALAVLIALLRRSGAWRRRLAVARFVLWSTVLFLGTSGSEAWYAQAGARDRAERDVLAIVGEPGIADAITDGVGGGIAALLLTGFVAPLALLVQRIRTGRPAFPQDDERTMPRQDWVALVGGAVVTLALAYALWPGTG